jgi:colanic acid/amylovoran biosynthesis glycosyltransferase
LIIAYLVNQYPQPSQTFIRREIRALEALGLTVERFTVRAWNQALVDPDDEAERQRTRVVLGAGAIGLAAATLRALMTRPKAFGEALRLALRVGRVSERGTLIHLIYLAEACLLQRWLAACGASHLHAHFGTNSATVAMLCRALGGPPYSVTVHGPEEFDMPRALSLSEKVRRSAFVVAVSEFGRSQLYRWAASDDWPKVQVVHCGLDRDFLDASATPVPAAKRLVCIGRLAEQKGQLALLQAAALLRDQGIDFELTLIGDGPMRGEVEAMIARLNLGSQVRLTGWMSNEAVRREIAGARALVLPSFAEGLPVVLMEALALGRPVVSTFVAGIPELVEPGVSGWLAPAGSVEALAAAIHAALATPVERLETMGRAGAARVARQHDAQVEAAKLADLFARSVGVGSGSNGPRASPSATVVDPSIATDARSHPRLSVGIVRTPGRGFVGPDRGVVPFPDDSPPKQPLDLRGEHQRTQ